MSPGYSVRETSEGKFIAERFLMSSVTFEYRVTNEGPERDTSKEAREDIVAMRQEHGE